MRIVSSQSQLILTLLCTFTADGRSLFLKQYYSRKKWQTDSVDSGEPKLKSLPKLLSLSYEAQVKKLLFGESPNFPKLNVLAPKILSPSLISLSNKQSAQEDLLSPALFGFNNGTKALIAVHLVEFKRFLQQLAQFNTAVVDEFRKLYRDTVSFNRILRDCDISKPNCPYVNAPGILTPTIGAYGLLNPIILSSYILSPYILGPFLLSSLIVSPFVLSPAALSPVFLAPIILSPMILSPGVLNPVMFSPVLLSPFILSPTVLSPNLFSPFVLSPCILSPAVLSPTVLSPGLLNPFIMCPSVLSDAVLSDCAYCPVQN